MMNQDTNQADPELLALAALGWTLSEESRAQRLLALTGLDPGDLRARVGEAAVLAAVLRFLESHEPDLIACAHAINVPPARLVEARRRLER
jgi:hypothetical protein